MPWERGERPGKESWEAVCLFVCWADLHTQPSKETPGGLEQDSPSCGGRQRMEAPHPSRHHFRRNLQACSPVVEGWGSTPPVYYLCSSFPHPNLSRADLSLGRGLVFINGPRGRGPLKEALGGLGFVLMHFWSLGLSFSSCRRKGLCDPSQVWYSKPSFELDSVQ